MSTKRAMTLNLSPREMDALNELAERKEISKTAVIRQALRFYQMVEIRIEQGEKVFIENEAEDKKAEIVVL